MTSWSNSMVRMTSCGCPLMMWRRSRPCGHGWRFLHEAGWSAGGGDDRHDPDTGLSIKGKADWLPSTPDPDGVLRIRDYKTTVKSPDEFERSCWQYGYHIQAAFYMRLYRLTMPEYKGPLGFEFVVQEKNPPFDWMRYEIQEDSPIITELAEPKINHALQGIRWFRDNTEDPLEAMRAYGLPKYPKDVVFPDWKLLEEEEEIESWR